jgi:hypothetical protein
MTKPVVRDPTYRRRRFEAEIIELCVRWYITYRLSYRDLVAMMAERGEQSNADVLRWAASSLSGVRPLHWPASSFPIGFAIGNSRSAVVGIGISGR